MALTAPDDLAEALALVPAPPRSDRVDAMLPGHGAYARVFSPARELGAVVSWSSLAGSRMHAGMQWDELRLLAARAGDIEPETATVDPGTAAALVALLRSRTTTPDRCFFLVWEGYAGLTGSVVRSPTTEIGPSRRVMHVLQGTIDDALENLDEPPFSRLPLWWLPADRAWAVGGDIYSRSVHVGGTVDTIAALVADRRLEAFRVPADHEVVAEDL